MQVRQLEFFHALMISGTMTKAAELLGVTQPAVSTTISNLEDELGFKLFLRKSGRLHPTPQADLYFAEVTRALSALESTKTAADEIRNGEYGRIFIAAFPSISMSLLPRIVSIYMEKVRGANVKIQSKSSNLVAEISNRGQCDIAIAELPEASRMDCDLTYSYNCECILPIDHPLAERSVISPADLDNVPFVSLFSDHTTYFQTASSFAKAKASWNIVAQVDYFSTVCELVAAGCGVGIVDKVISKPFTQNVVRRPFSEEIRYEIGVHLPPAQGRSKMLNEFLDILDSFLKE